MIPRVLYLQFETSGVAYSIHINGIKVAADRYEPQTQNSFPINQWLQPGRNELAVNLSVPYEQEEYREAKSALISIVEPTEVEGEQTTFSHFNWTDTLGQDFPINLNAAFHWLPDFPRPFWMDADELPPAAQADNALRSALVELHGALAAGDLARFQDAVRIKTGEMAAAYWMDPVIRLDGQRTFMGRMFGDPSWGMQPLGTDLAFELQAGGRLLTVTDRKGGTALKSTELSDGVEFGLELHFARKGGAWVVCR